MNRPILIVLIGYIIGIIWELYLKISIAHFIIILVIVAIIVKKEIDFFSKKMQKDTKFLYKNKVDHAYTNSSIKAKKTCIGIIEHTLNVKTIILLIISILISNNVTSYLNNKYRIIYNMSTEEQTYIGTIISDESRGEYKNSYTIKIENINGKTKYKNIKLILNIPKNKNTKLNYGDKIKITGNYVKPEVQRNYRGFDYAEYQKTIKVYGTITYSGSELKILKSKNLNNIELITHRINNNIEKNIKKLFKEQEARILNGILLGNNQDIDEQIKEDFRNSGIYHILVVSGAHMTYIILGFTYILDKINISSRKKVIIKTLGIIFFMLITTTSISVSRAGIMEFITLGASFFYRKKDKINTVCLSMLIILLYNPHSVNSISFQLSYGGVIGILLLSKPYEYLLRKVKINNKISEIISVILSAQTMIIPIMVINFHTISLTFLFANILVSYIIGIIIILGFICVFISLISLKISGFIAIFTSIALKILILISKIFGNIPLSKIYVTTPNTLSILLYYITIIIISLRHYIFWKKKTHKKRQKNKEDIYYKNIDKAIKTLAILAIITIINNNISISKNLRIHFIDVGQGDATLIITPNNKKILIDGGGTMNSSQNYDIGKNTMLPYLLDRGINKIDYMMISHFDADHCQALLAILNSIKVKNIIISKQAEKVSNYKKIMEIVIKKKINIMVIKRGDVINVDNYVEIQILYPESKLYFNDINNNSIVAKLRYNKFTMLFTGDIESKAEERITQITKKELEAIVLKVAHHGSKTSTTEEILKAVKPQIALIGVGKNNKFNNPNKEVLDRIKENRNKDI